MSKRSLYEFLTAAVLLVSASNAQSLTWQPAFTFNERWNHSMAEDPQRGRVLMFGGSYGEGVNEAWDPWEQCH